MLNSLKSMFGIKRASRYRKLIDEGAYIVDVRTRKEFQDGHIHGSINIPLNQLREGMSRFQKDQIIITCCASGLRSASARNVLRSMGYRQVLNGGDYVKLKKII
jgi:phage shock protein E